MKQHRFTALYRQKYSDYIPPNRNRQTETKRFQKIKMWQQCEKTLVKHFRKQGTALCRHLVAKRRNNVWFLRPECHNHSVFSSVPSKIIQTASIYSLTVVRLGCEETFILWAFPKKLCKPDIHEKYLKNLTMWSEAHNINMYTENWCAKEKNVLHGEEKNKIS